MKLIKVSSIFEVKYGVNLELNKLTQTSEGLNFVSRTAKNNGVSATVAPIKDIYPIPAGTISVACGGSVMESFLQPEPYYSGRDLYYLTAKINLTDEEKLFYCSCLRANKYRFNYGRQANRTLSDILIPSKEEIPNWITKSNVHQFDNANQQFTKEPPPALDTTKWSWFRIDELFDIKKGKRLTKANMSEGKTPFIGAIDSNNGYRQFISHHPIHDGNTITVNYNGNGVAEAFYQPKPFWATDDVNVLYPKFELNQYIALFITTLIKLDKYRFNYGRKWHMQRMKESEIKLPAKNNGIPNYELMERYIKALPFSKTI